MYIKYSPLAKLVGESTKHYLLFVMLVCFCVGVQKLVGKTERKP